MYIVFLDVGYDKIPIVCYTFPDCIKCMMDCNERNIPYILVKEV